MTANPVGAGWRAYLGASLNGMSETKIALVTGANKGIGYAIASGLGALGYRVAVGARDAGRRETAAGKLRAAGAGAFGVPLDVTGDQSVAGAAELPEREAGRLDVLVNNAGISGELGPGWVQDPAALDLGLVRTVVESNVSGVIRVTNAMLPLLRRSSSPRIVNISSSVDRLLRAPHPGAGCGNGDPARHAARRRPVRCVLRGRGRRPLVTDDPRSRVALTRAQ